MFRSPALLLLIPVAFAFAIIGCSEDDVVAPSLGMIVISAAPDNVSTPWTLSLPNGLHAVGDSDTTLLDMEPGQYTLTWLDSDGWISPDPSTETGTLAKNGTLIFRGTFTNVTIPYGTIVVDPDPSGLEISWTLTGPEEYMYEGVGDVTLHNLALGAYTLTWETIAGWDRSSDEVVTGTLTEGTRLVFNATYEEQPGTIRVQPLGSLTAPWQLVVQDTLSTVGDLQLDTLYIHNGSGDQTLEDLPAGDYVIYWNDVVDYMTPAPVTHVLSSGQDLVISDTYILTYIPIIAGSFLMGDVYASDETAHGVALTHNFKMRATEINIQEYCDMLNWAEDYGQVPGNPQIINIVREQSDPDRDKIKDLIDGSNAILFDYGSSQSDITYSPTSGFRCEDPYAPIQKLSWYGAAAYCDWMNLKDGYPPSYDHSDWSVIGGDVYALTGWRLPTEAEWEYACRAGTATTFNTGACLDPDMDANYFGGQPMIGCPAGSQVGDTVPVASYPENAYGLYDMHGNVAEWCWDLYASDAYTTGPGTDPSGPATGAERVFRGGSYNDGAINCRSASRHSATPETMRTFVGFRIVRTSTTK